MRTLYLFFALILLLAPVSSYANDDFIKGSAQFYSKSSDSLSFVKKFLLYQGFRDVISNALKKMGKTPEDFWLNYDKHFERYFSQIKKKLDEKYEVVEGEPTKNPASYFKKIRFERLNELRKFGDLDNVIESYVVKRMSRSARDSNMRFIDIEAKVNDVALSKLYFGFIKKERAFKLEKLFIALDFELKGLSWRSLGDASEQDFRNVLMEYWHKWFRENVSSEQVQELVFVSEEESFKHRTYLAHQSKVEEIEENKLINTAFLSVVLRLKKQNARLIEDSIKLEISGHLTAFDLESRRAIFNFDIPSEHKELQGAEGTQLSTIIANYIYRRPLPGFLEFKKSFDKIALGGRTNYLKVRGLKNIDEVMKFLDLLALRGMEFSLTPKLKSFSQQVCEFALYHHGGPQKVAFLLDDLSQDIFWENRQLDILDSETVRIKFAEVIKSPSS